MLQVETAVASGDWDPDIDWAALASRACAAALALTPHAGLAEAACLAEVSVRLSGNDEVQSLNAAYRGKDRPTNVLSFPMVEASHLDQIVGSGDAEILLGDIILAGGVVAAESDERAIRHADHATHLIVHGLLHLLGYDHETDDDAECMEALERKALAGLGLPDPYALEGRRLTDG